MKNTHRLFIPFGKVDEQEDGTLKVYGVASSETEDSDGEVVTSDAMRAALPDYMTFGAVREMHQPIAAGTAISAKVSEEGKTEFGAHVVDPVSVKKVQTGVLKGFSIGGRITKRNADDKNRIEGLKLTEISLVDRPANPDAKILLVKFGKDGHALEERGQLRKGMYDVARLADLLCSLNYLTQSVQSEAVYEGDNSAVGGKLHAACENLVGILKDLVDEETAEMLGVTSGDVAAMAAKASTISTASLVRSFSDKLDILSKRATSPGEAMNDAEKADLKKAQDALAETTTQLEKARKDAADAAENVTKADAARKVAEEKLTKATADLAAATKERDELAAESQKLVESLTAKGHVRSVSKESDVSPTAETEAAKAQREKDAKDPVALVKQSFAKPIVMDPRKPGSQGAAS